MDKYIKIDQEVWKKLKLTALISEKTIKGLATEYIIKGVKKRFHKNSQIVKGLVDYEKKTKKEEKGKRK